MTTLNRNPVGLLGFLGIKNGGRYPQQLSEVLAGTVDLAGLYMAQDIRSASVNSSVAAPGFSFAFEVPPGEVWYAHQYGFRTVELAAGEVLQYALGVSDNQGAGIPVPISDAQYLSVGQAGVVGTKTGLWLPAGSLLGVYCVRFTAGGPIAVNYAVRYTPFIM